MSTKNNPGRYDCYVHAERDEPMFVLLGRDVHAPALVREWADIREEKGEPADKIQEARECADAMVLFRAQRAARGGVACELKRYVVVEVPTALGIVTGIGRARVIDSFDEYPTPQFPDGGDVYRQFQLVDRGAPE